MKHRRKRKCICECNRYLLSWYCPIHGYVNNKVDKRNDPPPPKTQGQEQEGEGEKDA